MPSPFPGVDPYLENPDLWPEVQDVEVQVDLQALLGGVYDRAGFDLAVDYTQPPVPLLKGEDAVWADALLRERGLR